MKNRQQMGAEGNCRFTESNQFGLKLIQREIKTWNVPLISQSQRFPKIPEAFKSCHFFGITRSIARPWHCQMTARQNPARLRYLCRLQSENYTLPGTGTCLSLLRLWLWRLWLAQFDWHPAKIDLCQIYKQLDRKWSHHLPLCCQEWIYPTFASILPRNLVPSFVLMTSSRNDLKIIEQVEALSGTLKELLAIPILFQLEIRIK